MPYYTILKGRDDGGAAGARYWSVVAPAVEGENEDEALNSVVGDSQAGEGDYMIVEVKALRRVKAKTEFSVEPMEPPVDPDRPVPTAETIAL